MSDNGSNGSNQQPAPNPFDIFRETTPLESIPKDSIDEFLDRINEDLIAGAIEAITDERLNQLAAIFREEAVAWEIKQREKPARGTRATKEPKAVGPSADFGADIL